MTSNELQINAGDHLVIEIGPVIEIEFISLLGSGAYGSVWKVADCRTAQCYALKIIQGIVPGSVDEYRVRMEAEVSIPSDYIVPVVGLREWGPNTFLILFEYFEGTALNTLLAENALLADQKRQVFTQALWAVADAHRNNVIHRDLKPANILVDSDGNARLIDFGISKFKARRGVTMTGVIIGTWPYIAPELITDEGARVADARTDIYSLGQIFYEIVVGENFWRHKGWRDLGDMLRYLKRVPPPTELIEIDDFNCSFYENACDVLPRMVKINPDERYASIDDVLRDLGETEAADEAVEPFVPPDIHLRHPLLIVETGTNQGARTLLNLNDGDSLVLGRADIAGSDTSISRQHLRFRREEYRYLVSDLGSKNGTIISGTALGPDGPPREVHHGDRIKVGDVFLRFALTREQ